MCAEVLAIAIQAHQDTKELRVRNKETKITQYADDTFLYLNGSNLLENVKFLEDCITMIVIISETQIAAFSSLFFSYVFQGKYVDPTVIKERTVTFVGFSDSTDTTRSVMALLFGTTPEDIIIDSNNQETATTAEVVITIKRHNEILLRISLDHVPCIKLNFWPSVGAEWKERKRKWPDAEQIDAILKHGCHLVPKSSPGGDITKEWRFSFSQAEILLTEMQSPSQRNCYALFKILFYKYLKPIKPQDPQGNGLFSYLCKTVMMWFCEDHPPSNEIWNNLTICIDKLLEELQYHLRHKHLKNYFIVDINLMGQLSDDVVQRAVDMITDMRLHLLFYVPYDLPEVLKHSQYVTGKFNLIFNVVRFIAGFRQFRKSVRNVLKMNKK